MFQRKGSWVEGQLVGLFRVVGGEEEETRGKTVVYIMTTRWLNIRRGCSQRPEKPEKTREVLSIECLSGIYFLTISPGKSAIMFRKHSDYMSFNHFNII